MHSFLKPLTSKLLLQMKTIIFLIFASVTGELQAQAHQSQNLDPLCIENIEKNSFNSVQNLQNELTILSHFKAKCCTSAHHQKKFHPKKRCNKKNKPSKKEQCCQKIVINKLPYTISKSGCYSLSKDFNLTNKFVSGSAITVLADNVDIDFCGHTITLPPAMVGINAPEETSSTGVSNLSVHNGTIRVASPSSDPNSIGLNFKFVNTARITDMSFLNLSIGTNLNACNDHNFLNCKYSSLNNDINVEENIVRMTIADCEFTQLPNSTIQLVIQNNGLDITIQNCTFLGFGNEDNVTTGFPGMIVLGLQGGNIINTRITGCSFTSNDAVCIQLSSAQTGSQVLNTLIDNCSFIMDGIANNSMSVCSTGIEAHYCIGLQVENCTFQSTFQNLFWSIYMQPSPNSQIISDVVLRNNTFSNLSASTQFNHLNIVASQGILIEQCIFDLYTLTTPASPAAGASIFIQTLNGQDPSDGIKINNCLIRNTSSYGIWCLGGEGAWQTSDVEIANCLIEGTLNSGILLDNTAIAVIKDSEVNATLAGPGIQLQNGSTSNRITNNTVLAALNNDGLNIDSTCTFNIIDGNTFSNNNGFGINNSGDASNKFYNNTAGNNGFGNFFGVPFVVPQGTPSVSGENISL